jgi:AcrR family transcriptional regulator
MIITIIIQCLFIRKSDMSPRPRNNERHPDLQTAIKETAWRQISQSGAASLNLRAIARELNITAPSIYNYFPNRDALVTALIVDAFSSFADALQASITSIPEQEHAQRLYALGISYRDWAIAKPERYQLIFGTPIAGYVAPMHITQPVAGRSLAVLVSVLAVAFQAGRLQPETGGELSPKLRTMFAAWQDERGAANEQVLFLAISIWGQVHGLVSVEIGQQYPPFITDAGEIYRHALDLLVRRYFMF